MVLQCCFEGSLLINDKTFRTITHSDNGCMLSFVTTLFVKKFRLQPMRVWRWSIQTLSDTKSVSINFYRLIHSTTTWTMSTTTTMMLVIHKLSHLANNPIHILMQKPLLTINPSTEPICDTNLFNIYSAQLIIYECQQIIYIISQ